jgi:hypothetical protein
VRIQGEFGHGMCLGTLAISMDCGGRVFCFGVALQVLDAWNLKGMARYSGHRLMKSRPVHEAGFLAVVADSNAGRKRSGASSDNPEDSFCHLIIRL